MILCPIDCESKQMSIFTFTGLGQTLTLPIMMVRFKEVLSFDEESFFF